LGLSPLDDLSAAGAAQPAKFSYDLVGRLTAVTAAISAVTLVPDAEGNLTNAQ
jgi:YD repeat-containing protein